MRLSLYIDGASKGNPGRASVGAVVTDEQGRVLGESSRSIGTATNNQAEYMALLHGLEVVERIMDKRLEDVALVARSDSQLLCRQMSGQYRIKNKALLRLSLEVRERVRQFGSFVLECIPREQNRRADSLANAALRGRRG